MDDLPGLGNVVRQLSITRLQHAIVATIFIVLWTPEHYISTCALVKGGDVHWNVRERHATTYLFADMRAKDWSIYEATMKLITVTDNELRAMAYPLLALTYPHAYTFPDAYLRINGTPVLPQAQSMSRAWCFGHLFKDDPMATNNSWMFFAAGLQYVLRTSHPIRSLLERYTHSERYVSALLRSRHKDNMFPEHVSWTSDIKYRDWISRQWSRKLEDEWPSRCRRVFDDLQRVRRVLDLQATQHDNTECDILRNMLPLEELWREIHGLAVVLGISIQVEGALPMLRSAYTRLTGHDIILWKDLPRAIRNIYTPEFIPVTDWYTDPRRMGPAQLPKLVDSHYMIPQS